LNNHSTSDPMNLDDFIVAENMSTPAGIAGSPSPDLTKQGEERPLRRHITAIPIKHRQASLPHFIPQSVPVPAHAPSAQNEFGYITRRHRKTSIDDRRTVSDLFFALPGIGRGIALFGRPCSSHHVI
jgi:GATA-binding protein